MEILFVEVGHLQREIVKNRGMQIVNTNGMKWDEKTTVQLNLDSDTISFCFYAFPLWKNLFNHFAAYISRRKTVKRLYGSFVWSKVWCIFPISKNSKMNSFNGKNRKMLRR